MQEDVQIVDGSMLRLQEPDSTPNLCRIFPGCYYHAILAIWGCSMSDVHE